MFTAFSMFPDQLLKALNRQATSDQDPWKLVFKQDLGVHSGTKPKGPGL